MYPCLQVGLKNPDRTPKAPLDPDVERILMFERLVSDFDGETNEIDRRIYYEVTG